MTYIIIPCRGKLRYSRNSANPKGVGMTVIAAEYEGATDGGRNSANPKGVGMTAGLKNPVSK